MRTLRCETYMVYQLSSSGVFCTKAGCNESPASSLLRLDGALWPTLGYHPIYTFVCLSLFFHQRFPPASSSVYYYVFLGFFFSYGQISSFFYPSFFEKFACTLVLLTCFPVGSHFCCIYLSLGVFLEFRFLLHAVAQNRWTLHTISQWTWISTFQCSWNGTIRDS